MLSKPSRAKGLCRLKPRSWIDLSRSALKTPFKGSLRRFRPSSLSPFTRQRLAEQAWDLQLHSKLFLNTTDTCWPKANRDRVRLFQFFCRYDDTQNTDDVSG